MPDKSKSTKRRTKVRDIPQAAKPLSKEEQKKVKGGYKTVVIAMRKSGGEATTSGKDS